MRRLLVTGSAGYLGRELVRLAARRGLDVVGTWHRTPGPDGGGVQLDVRDEARVAEVVADASPDVVVHTAYSGRDDLLDVNVRGSAAVARAATAVGARLVHLSTDVVFGGKKRSPYVEDDEPRPITEYGRAKRAAEVEVLSIDPAAVAVRTSLLYGGAEGPVGPQERLVTDALGGADITFFTDELRCPVRVTDLAEAVLDLAALDVAGPLHVAGASAVSRYDFACSLARSMGRSPEGLRGAPSPGDDRPRHVVLDSSRAFALLGRELPGPT